MFGELSDEPDQLSCDAYEQFNKFKKLRSQLNELCNSVKRDRTSRATVTVPVESQGDKEKGTEAAGAQGTAGGAAEPKSAEPKATESKSTGSPPKSPSSRSRSPRSRS